jgi:hypothetical protein
VKSKFVSEEFDRFVIKAGPMSGKHVARAFNGPKLKKTGIIAETAGATTEDAVERLRELLLVSKAAEMAGRRRCEVNKVLVPSTGAYRIALQNIPLTQSQIAMLRAHASAGTRGLASHRIASAGGYKQSSSANSQYGAVGRLFADFLRIENLPKYPISQLYKNKDYATSALAHQGTPEDGLFVWVMYHELHQALIDEGLASPKEPSDTSTV